MKVCECFDVVCVYMVDSFTVIITYCVSSVKLEGKSNVSFNLITVQIRICDFKKKKFYSFNIV